MKQKNNFDTKDFAIRLAFAFILVCVTYNSTGYSFVHWFQNIFPKITPLFAVGIVVLIIGWAIFLRATLRSLGGLGVFLLCALIAAIVWLFWDIGWLSLTNVTLLSWVADLSLSLILAVGMSWSHIRRKLTGQLDVDNVDN